MLQPAEQDRVLQLIKEVGLEDRTSDIISFIKPSIVVRTEPINEDKLPLGSSKLGGLPDLPSGVVWPEYGGKALSFIGQINLQHIAMYSEELLLPSSGILYFFYDNQQWIDNEPYYRTLYYQVERSALHRCDAPSTVEKIYDTCLPSFVRQLTLPPFESYSVKKILGLSYDNIYDPRINAYFELDKNFFYIGQKTVHRIGGYPDQEQGDIFYEAEIYSRGLRFNADDYDTYGSEIQKWRLLLQVDSDDNANMMWGDVGKLYYSIKQDDLEEQKFENVFVEMQCG